MRRVAVGILRMNGKILLCQRKKGGHYELKWEFPGGKLEEAETVLDCLRRELKEELSLEVGSVERIEFQTSRYYDGGTYQVAYCTISDFQGEPRNNVFEQIRWVKPSELLSFDHLEGNKGIVDQLSHE